MHRMSNSNPLRGTNIPSSCPDSPSRFGQLFFFDLLFCGLQLTLWILYFLAEIKYGFLCDQRTMCLIAVRVPFANAFVPEVKLIRNLQDVVIIDL
ncbi:hypothetical protein I7I48_00962 [Histoplasma ohiense]|nr:hypothetical protein I7I48_00962 [Histoplasma ohiense (nom. inval.)]